VINNHHGRMSNLKVVLHTEHGDAVSINPDKVMDEAKKSTISAFRHSFFVTTPFLWNSIPFEILSQSIAGSF